MRRGLVLPGMVLLLGLLACIACQAPVETEAPSPAPPPGSLYDGQAFTFHKVRDDIYHAVGTGNLAVGCNGSIVINDEDILIVDSHISPAAAWALLKELKTLSPKPVRYVVNTHFHFDHAHGNQIFGDDVEIIGHEFTREKLAAGESIRGRTHDNFIAVLPDRVAEAEAAVAAAENDEARKEAEKRLAYQRNYLEATNAVVPKPPTTTLLEKMTLYRGGREIQLLFFGRGHTGGDVVVYLPEEKVVMTGDLLTAGLSYMGDAFANEWPDTLEELKRLDFEVVLPGHGAAFEDRSKIDYFQAYLRDFWSKVSELHRRGVRAEEAAEQIDMTNHSEHYANIEGLGVSLPAVQRAFEVLDAEGYP